MEQRDARGPNYKMDLPQLAPANFDLVPFPLVFLKSSISSNRIDKGKRFITLGKNITTESDRSDNRGG